MRIVSLVPGATHAVCLLGMRTSLVGVTHACADVVDLTGVDVRTVTRTRVPVGGTGKVVDQAVRSAVVARSPVQVLDAKALAALQPDVVIAPSERPGGPSACSLAFDEVRRACEEVEPFPPRMLTWGPLSIRDVLGAVRAIGEGIDRGAEAARLAAELRSRVEAVHARVALAPARPRVSLLVWVTPPMGAGGMLAEMVRIAGGDPVSGHPTEGVRHLDWAQVVAARPQVIVLAPCGFGIERARAESEALRGVPGLAETPAARWGQVHVVDAARWLSAPGASSVRGLEILARLIHPELPWPDGMLGSDVARPVSVE